MSAKPVLGYWDIRGLAQPIKLLLAYTGTEYQDKRFPCGPGPEFDRSQWFDNKFSFGLDFPNLPYYIDGDVKLSQSNAILRYIARKHDMLGKTDKEKAMVDMMAEETMDLRNAWIGLCYNPDFENLKEGYLNNLGPKMQQFSKFLASKPWFAGQSMTFVDFVMYELIDIHQQLVPNCVQNYPNLERFQERFERLPKIAMFMKSPQFMKAPLNNKMAKFGY